MAALALGPSWQRRIAVTLRIVVGLFFVVSAVAKLVGVDGFEIYLYSFGLLPLGAAMIAVRVVVVVELLLGVWLMTGMSSRLAELSLFLLTIAFTLFLGYAELSGRSDSCHCMGELLHFSPSASMLKNALLIVLLLLLLRLPHGHRKMRWWMWLTASMAVTAGVFAFSMPDNWMFSASDEPFNAEFFDELTQPEQPLSTTNVNKGHKALVIATEGCPYCLMTLQKLNVIATRGDIAQDAFIVVLPQHKTPRQFPTNGAPLLEGISIRLSINDFNRLCYGTFPTILLLDNASVVRAYNYRTIDENEIIQFLQP